MADEPLPIKSVGTTFAVVEAIARHDQASLDTLVSAVNASKSTVYKHLRTLMLLGYVAHTDEGYMLTDELAELTARAGSVADGWRAAVRDELSSLANTTGDVAGLLRLKGHHVVQFAQERGDASRQRGFTFQTTPHLHASAAGKVILAALNRERAEAILDVTGMPPLTEHTVTDEETLFAELDEIRERGVAVEREEQAPGVRGIAAPVEWEGGHPPGGLYVVGPVERMSTTRLERDLPDILFATVDRLEQIEDLDRSAHEGLAIPKR